MLENIAHTLNQVLIILFPIWFYHLFLHKKEIKNDGFKPWLFLVLTVSLTMTLVFSVNYSDHLVYDLKLIPIMIAFLYGSNLSGILLLLIAVAYKIGFQDGNALLTIINFSIAGVLFLEIRRKFRNYSLTFKIISTSIILWAVSITRGIWLYSAGHNEQNGIVLIFSFITWATFLSVVFIFENMEKQIELESKVQSAERFNVVGQLAAAVAHEVRNPMTAVKGFLQLMRNDDNLNDMQKRYIEISLKEIEHSDAIISEYLSLAKPAKTELDIIDLAKDLENIVELMKSFTNLQTVTIETFIEEGLLIKAEGSEVKQVFVNLIKNSIEAIGDHGKIFVNAYKNGPAIIIEIEDTGHGMSKEQLKNLGMPFYSTKDKGTGVGLTVSYKIVHSLKGTIKVESEEGVGTKFTIELPAV